MTQRTTLTVFDTLSYSKQARAHGFSEEQAEFQANEMAKFAKDMYTELATKKDLKILGDNLQHDMKEMEERLEYKMQGQEERLLHKLTVRFAGVFILGLGAISVLTTMLHNMIK